MAQLRARGSRLLRVAVEYRINPRSADDCWGCPIPVCHAAGPCHTLSHCDVKTCNKVLLEPIMRHLASPSRDVNTVRVEMYSKCRYTTTMAFFVAPIDWVSPRGDQRSLRRPCHGHVSIFGRGPSRSDLEGPAPSVPYLLTEWTRSHIKGIFRYLTCSAMRILKIRAIYFTWSDSNTGIVWCN